MQGGDITVTSEVGVGSVFRVELPVELAESGAMVTHEPAHRVVGLAQDQGEVRILNVDDKELNRLLVTELLTAVGFTVVEAGNGEEAITAFLTWSPRLVLMDMHMPVMDGFEAIRRIRKLAGGGDVRIVALTASVFEEDRKHILAEGADFYLRKPFKEEDLFGTLRTALGLTYLYDDEGASGGTTAVTAQTTVTREQVATLPAPLLTSLRAALQAADLDRLLELADSIGPEGAPIAEELRVLAGRFDYDALHNLLSAVA
jgi:CheY-like chemotaxis protein